MPEYNVAVIGGTGPQGKGLDKGHVAACTASSAVTPCFKALRCSFTRRSGQAPAEWLPNDSRSDGPPPHREPRAPRP